MYEACVGQSQGLPEAVVAYIQPARKNSRIFRCRVSASAGHFVGIVELCAFRLGIWRLQIFLLAISIFWCSTCIMFSMCKIRGGETYLEKHLTANDYYSEGESVTGVWHGRLAAMFRIEGQTICSDDERFENLRSNLSPDGSEKLTRRSKSDAIKFFDWQLSARKSVSIMSLFDPRIKVAHEIAGAEAFIELERFAGRRLKNGFGNTVDSELTGNLCAATFTHDTSRSLDPQLHTHFVVANATAAADGNRYALNELDQTKAVDYLGRVYHARMAQLLRELGHVVDLIKDDKQVGYEIRGVSPEIIQRFSQRRGDIEEAIRDFKYKQGHAPTKEQINVIAKETRDKKLTEISTPEVRAKQFSRMTSDEQIDLIHIATQAQKSGPRTVDGISDWKSAIEKAVAHVSERKSVFGSSEVAAEMLRENIERDVDGEKVREALAIHGLAAGLVELGREGTGVTALATSEINIEAEISSIVLVNLGKDSFSKLGQSSGNLSKRLSGDQKRVVEEVLSSKDFVISVRGPAGAGKTTTLAELDHHIKASGRNTVFLSPTTGAVDVLRGEGFEATTLSRFLLTKQDHQPRGSVVIVDESGLASVTQGAKLLQIAKASGYRILLVGDVRQHSAVEAGDFVRILEEYSKIQKSSLTEIWRQKGNKDYLEAAKMMASGQASNGFEKLESMGAIKECEENYLSQAAAAWLEKGKAAREEFIIVAPTHLEIEGITAALRKALIQDGTIESSGKSIVTTRSLGWTKPQAKNISNYRQGQLVTYTTGKRQGITLEVVSANKELGVVHLADGSRLDFRACFEVSVANRIEVAKGDRLMLTGNVNALGIRNGEIVSVESLHDGGMTLRKADGKTMVEVGPEFRTFKHGYAVTSHKSQGKTKFGVILAAARMDAKALYVGATRGKKSIEIFTPDKEELRASIAKSGDRQAAADTQSAGFAERLQTALRAHLPQAISPEEARKAYRSARISEARTMRECENPTPHRKHETRPNCISRNAVHTGIRWAIAHARQTVGHVVSDASRKVETAIRAANAAARKSIADTCARVSQAVRTTASRRVATAKRTTCQGAEELRAEVEKSKARQAAASTTQPSQSTMQVKPTDQEDKKMDSPLQSPPPPKMAEAANFNPTIAAEEERTQSSSTPEVEVLPANEPDNGYTPGF